MEFMDPLKLAFGMLLALDPELMSIISLSLVVSFTAVGAALVIVLPIGA